MLSFEKALQFADDRLDPADTTPDDACFWLYSSGTTGFPKGAVHLQHDMLFCAETYGRHVLSLSQQDRTFTVSPLFHAYGLGNGVFFPLFVGASAVYKPERPTPDLVYGLITQEKPTVLFTAPTFYAALLAYPEEGFRYDLSSLRFCVSAGESLPKPLFDAWKRRFGLEILDGIGSTEMLHIFISNFPGRAKGGTSGTVVPGYQARIVDDTGQPVRAGDTGDLHVSGDSGFAYYWNKHEKTKRTIKGEWVVTGDRYHQDEDGHYVYEGRSDDMLKVSGMWVSPAEVEAALMEHEAVLECGVVGAKDKDELTKPKAFVILKKGHEPSDALAEELKAYVKGRLAPYKYPRWVDFVTELPKTSTGKIQRYKLREPAPA
jgi:benzoate-CoA ligase